MSTSFELSPAWSKEEIKENRKYQRVQKIIKKNTDFVVNSLDIGYDFVGYDVIVGDVRKKGDWDQVKIQAIAKSGNGQVQDYVLRFDDKGRVINYSVNISNDSISEMFGITDFDFYLETTLLNHKSFKKHFSAHITETANGGLPDVLGLSDQQSAKLLATYFDSLPGANWWNDRSTNAMFIRDDLGITGNAFA